jgi:hypothetical protein
MTSLHRVAHHHRVYNEAWTVVACFGGRYRIFQATRLDFAQVFLEQVINKCRIQQRMSETGQSLVVLLGGRVSSCDRLYHRDTSTVLHPEMANEQAHLHAADMCSCFSHANSCVG